MRYCKSCKVTYNANLEHCMLCSDKLEHTGHGHDHDFSFPPYKAKSKFNKYFIKGTFFLNFISIALSLTLDFMFNRSFTWSLIVSTTNIYVILFVRLLLSDARFTSRLFWITILSVLEIVAIGYLTRNPSWAIEIVLPFSIILNTLILLIFTLAKRNRWQDYALFLILSSLTNIALILLPVFRITTNNWAIITSFFFGIFTIVALIIFTPKDLKEEFIRRIHI